MNFLTILGVTEILCSFKLVLEEKTGKEIPESSRLEFLEKILANNRYSRFAFVKKSISNSPKVLRANFRGSNRLFCFSRICEFGGFNNYFAMINKIFSVGKNEKNDFFEIWQQHKLLKTMEMSEVWPDTYDEVYIHQFQPEPTHKIY